MSKERAQTIIDEDIAEIVSYLDLTTMRQMEDKTIIITGPGGLLGGYIVEMLMYLNNHIFNNPCKIIGIIRRLSDRLLRFREHKWFSYTFLVDDVAEYPNFIVHAAGRSAPSSFIADPIGTIDANIILLNEVLAELRSDDLESIAYFSSSEIYGNPDPLWIPTTEARPGSTYSLGVRGCYTESKRCGEALCRAYYDKYQMPVKIFRPMLVYGPGLSINDGRVMAEFMKQGIGGKPIVMRGNPDAKRSYCYITDAMIFFWKIFLYDRNGEAFNLGNGRDMVTIRELAQMVHEICGITEGPTQVSMTKDNEDVLGSAPDIACVSMAKAQALTGYKAQTPLKYGLKRTIEWNKEMLS